MPLVFSYLQEEYLRVWRPFQVLQRYRGGGGGGELTHHLIADTVLKNIHSKCSTFPVFFTEYLRMNGSMKRISDAHVYTDTLNALLRKVKEDINMFNMLPFF